MNVPKSIFRQYDVRGLVGTELTPELARGLGRAFASVGVGAARPRADDRRRARQPSLGRRAGRAASAGASSRPAAPRWTSARCPRRRSISPSPRSAPTAASRSPARTIPPSSTASRWCSAARPSTARRSSSCGRSSSPSAGGAARAGRPATARCSRRYREGIVSRHRLARPVRVVVDCGNGAGSLVAVSTLEALGAEVTPLFCESDGTFPNHHPDPTVPENLRDLQAEVRRTGAELGHRVRRRRRPDRRGGRDRRDHLRRPAARHPRPRRGAPLRPRHAGHLRREVLRGAARGARGGGRRAGHVEDRPLADQGQDEGAATRRSRAR